MLYQTAEQETETVTVESVRAMIDALPDAEEISADNAEEVAEQLEAIDKAKAKLSDEEIDALNFTKYMKAAAALGELSAPMLTANEPGEVSTEGELTAALANGSIPKITLMSDITISSTLTVGRTVTLDLNGCVLKMTGSGSVITIKSRGSLTIEDSNMNTSHNFNPDSDGLWVLDDNGAKTVSGGVITGGTGTQVSYYEAKGGGVYIEPEGSLVMKGGSIVGCKAYDGGGVVVEEGCNFIMNLGSEISYCTAKEKADTRGHGGGVMINSGTELGRFTMDGGKIYNCTAEKR